MNSKKQSLLNMTNLAADILGLGPTDGPFNIEDFISHDSWIDNAALSVPDLSLLPPNRDCPTEDVWEQVIPSPSSSIDLLGSSDELGESFLEKFIDLAAVDTCTNSVNIGTFCDTTSTVLNDLLVSPNQVVTGEEIPVENYGSTLVTPSPSRESVVDVETTGETDSVALVPEAVEEICSDNDFVPNAIFPVTLDVPSTLPDITQLDPSMLSLLECFENSGIPDENKVIPNTRKRGPTNEVEGSTPAVKKSKFSESSSLLPSTELPSTSDQCDKVAARRKKNNEASRVCRATRKARHQELFDKEKDLIRENKDLTLKIEELSNTVVFLRNYLVEKLSRK